MSNSSILVAFFLFSALFSCATSPRLPPNAAPARCAWGRTKETEAKISIQDVFSRNKQLEGRRVEVTGCLNLDFEETGLYRDCKYMKDFWELKPPFTTVVNPLFREEKQPQEVLKDILFIQLPKDFQNGENNYCHGKMVSVEGYINFSKHGRKHLGELEKINSISEAPLRI